MTRRAIDIDDETWRRIKVEAAERGLTVKEVVNARLRTAYPVTMPSHMDVAGVCQLDGEDWPCSAVEIKLDDALVRMGPPPDLSESLE